MLPVPDMDARWFRRLQFYVLVMGMLVALAVAGCGVQQMIAPW